MHGNGDNQKLLERLPEVIRRMAEIVGLDNALALAREFAGSEVYIPKMDCLYREVRDAAIRAAYDGKEATVKELARRHKLTERQIYNILGDQPEAETPTLPFFAA